MRRWVRESSPGADEEEKGEKIYKASASLINGDVVGSRNNRTSKRAAAAGNANPFMRTRSIVTLPISAVSEESRDQQLCEGRGFESRSGHGFNRPASKIWSTGRPRVTSAQQVTFSLCLFVYHYSTDFHKIWWKGGTRATEESIRFCYNPDHVLSRLGLGLRSTFHVIPLQDCDTVRWGLSHTPQQRIYSTRPFYTAASNRRGH